MVLQTPIAVVAHDRPEHLGVTLEALSRCAEFSECPLFIFCDAPRSGHHAKRAGEVRQLSHKWVAERGGRVIERPSNMGFGNLVDAVTALCNEYGCAIVVEDDVVAAPDFLSFMRSSLTRYENEERVYNVNGFMFFDAHPPQPTTLFLPTAFATGWATWQRAWRHFEWRPKGIEKFFADRDRRRQFDFDGKWRISNWLEKAMNGGLACWDPQWAYKIFDSGAVGLFPHQSLIWNTGMGCGMGVSGEAIPNFDQCHDKTFYGDLTMRDFEIPRLQGGWKFPEKIEVSDAGYQSMVEIFRRERARLRQQSRGPWWRRYPQSLLQKVW